MKINMLKVRLKIFFGGAQYGLEYAFTYGAQGVIDV